MADNEQVIKIFAPVYKTTSGKYEVVLSDTSLDRDEEMFAKSFLDESANVSWVNGLIDHENSALKIVNEWANKRVVRRGNDYALVAEPKFFMSNPNAQVIKGMLDEGARIPVSVTVMPRAHKFVEKDGKKIKQFTSGELLSADWVGIGSNRNAGGEAMIAKRYDTDKKFIRNDEVDNMGEPNIEALEKSLKAEVGTLKGELLEAVKGVSKAYDEKFTELAKQVTDLSEAVKKMAEEDDDPTTEPDNETPEEKAAKKDAELKKSIAEKKAELEKAEKERAELLKALRNTPNNEGDAATKSAVNPDDTSAGAFIKAYNPQARQEVEE